MKKENLHGIQKKEGESEKERSTETKILREVVRPGEALLSVITAMLMLQPDGGMRKKRKKERKKNENRICEITGSVFWTKADKEKTRMRARWREIK